MAGVFSRLRFADKSADRQSDHLKAVVMLSQPAELPNQNEQMNQFTQLVQSQLKGLPVRGQASAEEVFYGRGDVVSGKFAAMHLVAAGINPRTLHRDAPRLDDKIENGFSGWKKWYIFSANRATVKKPENHLLPRLQILEKVQQAITGVVFPQLNGSLIAPANRLNAQLVISNQRIELRQGNEVTEITPNHCASLMLLALPRDFLVLKPELVRRFNEICAASTAAVSEEDKVGALHQLHIQLQESLQEFSQRVTQDEQVQHQGLDPTNPRRAQPLSIRSEVRAADELIKQRHRVDPVIKMAVALGHWLHRRIGRPFMVRFVEPQIRASKAIDAERKNLAKLQQNWTDQDRELVELFARLDALQTTPDNRAFKKMLRDYITGGSIEIRLSQNLADDSEEYRLLADAIAYTNRVTRENQNIRVTDPQLIRVQTRRAILGLEP
ncbi:MAG TPA: hypothetical protein VFV43_05910 [Limnobacter sp.]|nr:hypothetical protein [Limnobacter sp.]